jgi:hypothetical protein
MDTLEVTHAIPAHSDQQEIHARDQRKSYQSKEEFIHDHLDFFIKDYRNKRNQSRDSAGRFKIINILTAGMVTLLLGIKSSPVLPSTADGYLSLGALVLSACITSLNIWESFADYRWKWIRYRATLSALYTIRDDFLYAKSGGSVLTAELVDNFYDQLKRAVHETNEEWMSQRGTAIGGGTNNGGQSSAKP